jgi:ElaB/YqjD/DUF883 family membrane-anchored ribosome-binding protein
MDFADEASEAGAKTEREARQQVRRASQLGSQQARQATAAGQQRLGQAQADARETYDHVADLARDKLEQLDESVSLDWVGQRPWLSFGAALLTGYLLGSMGGSSARSVQYEVVKGRAEQHPQRSEPQTRSSASSWFQTAGGSGVASEALTAVGDELSTLKQAAIGTIKSMMSDASRSLAASSAYHPAAAPSQRPE